MAISKKKKEKKQISLAEGYVHRGYHDKPEIPENSMSAFRRAIEHGMAAEIDVHLIADGSLVVFHDDDLERETGKKGRIADFSLERLKGLRLEGTDEQIPTFDEVLELFEDSGLPLLIELKVDRRNHKQLARAVAKRLARYRGDYAVQSFYPRAILAFRRLMPHVHVGQLSKNYFNKDDGAAAIRAAMIGNLLFNKLVKPDFVAYKFRDRKSRALRRSMDKHDMKRLAWTIRTPEAYLEAVAEGCIPIFEGFDPGTMRGGLR